ncbi:MAG TPA: hypothetical protein V6C72_01000, partial [Chroococcales cyanobacterium]
GTFALNNCRSFRPSTFDTSYEVIETISFDEHAAFSPFGMPAHLHLSQTAGQAHARFKIRR